MAIVESKILREEERWDGVELSVLGQYISDAALRWPWAIQMIFK
jgi:hypothetical protein